MSQGVVEKSQKFKIGALPVLEALLMFCGMVARKIFTELDLKEWLVISLGKDIL